MGICRYCALAPAACGRELTDLPLFPPLVPSSSLLLLSPSARQAVLCPVPAAVLPGISVPVAESSARDAQAGGRTMCHLRCAIPYSVPTMICSRLVPRSRWISFIGVRVCPTSIYRRGVPCTGYSQYHKEGSRGASPWPRYLALMSKVFRVASSVGKSSVRYEIPCFFFPRSGIESWALNLESCNWKKPDRRCKTS